MEAKLIFDMEIDEFFFRNEDVAKGIKSQILKNFRI